jgi:hypothetical protein
MSGDEGPSLGSLDLRAALAKEGCPLCRLVREGEERWLWQLLYEFSGDPAIREELDRASGLCHAHAHLLIKVVEERELVSGDTVARIYETVVRHYRRRLEALPRTKGRGHRGSRASRAGQGGGERCPLCLRREELELREARLLLGVLEDGEWRASYRASDGLCNPHLLLALEEAGPHLQGFLIADHIVRLKRLEQELAELQRKQRYDVAEPITPEEARSWREAIWRFTGMEYDRPLIRRQR